MNKRDATRVAQAMCKASYILWEAYKDVIVREAKNPKVTDHGDSLGFDTRIGTGKSTYCTFDRRRGSFILNYGWKMVSSKCESPSNLKGWTTGSEIADKGYMGGEATILNAIVHTVVHEFGHVWQDSRHEVKNRSVHNAEFYRILDRMYAEEVWSKVYSSIKLELELQRIELVFDDPDKDVGSQSERTGDYKKGDRISFTRSRSGGHCFAIITRTNKKTVSVTGCKAVGEDFRGTVPYRMLSPAPLNPVEVEPEVPVDPWAAIQINLRSIK